MTEHYSIHEWGSLPIGTDPGCISRASADELCLVARQAQPGLGVGGNERDTILEHHVSHLRASQVVGVIAAPGVSLEVLPKIDGLEGDDRATRLNLVRMLAQTLDLQVADGALAALGLQNYDLLEILIRIFAEKLFSAVHRGLPRRYIRCEEDLPALRGALNVQRQFTVLSATPHRLAASFDELSPDIALNRLMKVAVHKLRSRARSLDNQRRLSELALAFADVANVGLEPALNTPLVLDRTNASWHELVRLARLLLRSEFQTTSRGETSGYSLLFDMNVLFEEFIGRVFQKVLKNTGCKVTLQGPRGFVLSELNGSSQRFQTRPDLVLELVGGSPAIIDTKWKRLKGALEDPRHGVGQADVYQMLAYGGVYQAGHLLLLYPHHSQIGSEAGFQQRYEVIGTQGRTLSVASISLTHLDTIPAQLRAIVAQLGGDVPLAA